MHTYLGIDVDRAEALAARLRHVGVLADDSTVLAHEASDLAHLSTGAAGFLREIERDLVSTASAVSHAAQWVAAFRSRQLVMPWLRVQPETTSPKSSGLAWNHHRQDASHNSYEFAGGMAALFRNGVRTFELDTHRGAPTDFGSGLSVIADHRDHRGGRDGDWRVYHVSGSAASEYRYLSDGLAELAQLETTEPLTLFIDNKDGFGGAQSVTHLEQLLQAHLGDRLYTPGDLQRRSPGFDALHEAVAGDGWPTITELQGRILVVVTDNVAGLGEQSTVFVAAKPRFDRVDGVLIHRPEPDVVFYNAAANDVDDEEIVAVQAGGFVIRTFGNSPCGPPTFDPDLGPGHLVGLSPANFRARHASFGPAECAAAAPHPPEGTPVPVG